MNQYPEQAELVKLADLDEIPNVNLILEVIHGIIQTEQETALAVNQARRQMEEEQRQKELQLRKERLAKVIRSPTEEDSVHIHSFTERYVALQACYRERG